MSNLRVNELLVGDRVVVEATAHTIIKEAQSRVDVWVGVRGCYYRVIYTGAYNYLTVLKALDDPRNNNVYCEVLYSGPEDKNKNSEIQLAAHAVKMLLLDNNADLYTTQCY